MKLGTAFYRPIYYLVAAGVCFLGYEMCPSLQRAFMEFFGWDLDEQGQPKVLYLRNLSIAQAEKTGIIRIELGLTADTRPNERIRAIQIAAVATQARQMAQALRRMAESLDPSFGGSGTIYIGDN